MLLSQAFLLALISTLYCNSQTLQVPLEVDAKPSSLMSNSQWNAMKSKLTLIRRAQEDQDRKLIFLQLKLNQVLSKLISLTHGTQPISMMALERLESNTKKMETLLRFQHAQSLEQMQKLEKCSGNGNVEMPKEQMSVENKPETVEYVQPAKADCYELDEQQRVDGVYRFLEPELNEVQRDFNERYCAFATDGPAWTVIQKRRIDNGRLKSFKRSWDEYRAGFGSLDMDFWFGNEFIHRIVYRDDYVLRIELEDHKATAPATVVWAEYGIFRLDSDSYNYQLVIGKLNGNSTASDALAYHNQMDFRTFERDESCNGWWFGRCLEAKSNLNGHSIIWGNWHNEYELKGSRMLIRPQNFNLDITVDIYDEDEQGLI